MEPEEANRLQAAYRKRRVKWAREIGRPYSETQEPAEPTLGDERDDAE